MDKPAKAAKPAARKRTAAPRKPTPRKRTTAAKPIPVEVVAAPVVIQRPAVTITPRPSLRVIAGFCAVLTAAAAAAMLLLGQSDEAAQQDPGGPLAVSAAELVSFAGAQGTPVYWAGELPLRTMELTTTATGTFVRYLPSGTALGGAHRALTIATYPLLDAYGTASRRAKEAGMTSRPTRNGGLAVWSKAQPTSVYVAFRGVRSLVEVYAPQAKEARTLALSGRIRAVR